MITKLHETSSQFVVGSSARLLGRKRSRVKMMDRLHAIPRDAISLVDYPDIMSDVFLWNKMFRKDFWDSAVRAPFPRMSSTRIRKRRPGPTRGPSALRHHSRTRSTTGGSARTGPPSRRTSTPFGTWKIASALWIPSASCW